MGLASPPSHPSHFLSATLAPRTRDERMHVHDHRSPLPLCFVSCFQASTYEVDADGGDVRVGKGVVREPQEEAGLAHARVPDQDELEEKVIITLGHDCLWVVCV